jgi:superfamily II DNA or RNA helicase
MPTAIQGVFAGGNAARTSLVERLLQIVLGWRGAERNQPITQLHAECVDAAGPSAHLLLPARVFPVHDLDRTSLRAELARRRLLRSEADPRFRVPPTGRFDAALVPGGPTGQPCDRWWMFVEESLPNRDQHSLFAHALAHGLLNEEARRLGRGTLPLDPRDGFVHWELLGELRLLENARQPQDRRVLEAYPQLAELLRLPAEPSATSPADQSLLERLAIAGWRGQRVDAPYTYTAGRVYVSDGGIHRGRRLRVDALLRAERSLPIAVAHLLRPREDDEEALARLEELARERLGLPYAYLVRPGGGIVEIDRTGGGEGRRSTLAEFPTPPTLLDRWLIALGLDDDQARNVLCFPYEVQAGQQPRYYQEAAINQAVAAVLQARRSRRPPRVLVTLATGTGKTKVAFQIVWKLKQVRSVKNVLFITDRDWLLTQAMDNEFAPFRDARARIRGELKTAQDVFFATYHALAASAGRKAFFLGYPRDYFDLIIIDECHRGSADKDSEWQDILVHFRSAVQIGMTATPLHDDRVDTASYFGDPVAVYSLRRGINDGYLAPYRVRRVLMHGEDETGEYDGAEPAEPPAMSEEQRARLEAGIVPARVLVGRTDEIAAHLARYLRTTDPLAKTIVFCADVAHAGLMRDALEREFAVEVAACRARQEDYIQVIVHDEKRALGRFTDPEQPYPVVATTSRLLSTGVDIPTCKNIVLARPVNSIVEFKQIIGRGTRLREPQKTWFTIVDYAGATRHFYDEQWDGDPQFVDVDRLLPAVPQDSAEAMGGPPGGDAPTGLTSSDSPTPEQSGGVEAGAGSVDSSPAQPVATGGQAPTAQVNGSLPAVGESPSGTPDVISPGAEAPTTPPGPDGDTTAANEETPGTTVPGQGEPVAAEGPAASDQVSTPDPSTERSGPGDEPPSPPEVPTGEARTRRRDGRRFVVVGEIVYELGPDGRTLREVPYLEYAREAIGDDCPTTEALRERWLKPDLRRELEGRLADDGVDLDELAAVFGLSDSDSLDVLAHALFRTPVPTRQERVARLRERHADWLGSFSAEAREVLDLILRKFEDGEAPDVSDTGLLRVPPLSDRGTFMELAGHFGGGSGLRATLAELRRRLFEP